MAAETTPTAPLIAAEAARRLDMPLEELLRLTVHRKIRYVMVDGIAHYPEDALDEYRRQAASCVSAASCTTRERRVVVVLPRDPRTVWVAQLDQCRATPTGRGGAGA